MRLLLVYTFVMKYFVLIFFIINIVNLNQNNKNEYFVQKGLVKEIIEPNYSMYILICII